MKDNSMHPANDAISHIQFKNSVTCTCEHCILQGSLIHRMFFSLLLLQFNSFMLVIKVCCVEP